MSGKSCCRYLRAKTAAGPATATIRSGLGRVGEGGSDVVDDRLFGRADKPCRTDDDLDDVHGLSGTLVQFDAEVAGEVVHRQVAAVERLQQQDLSDRRAQLRSRRPSSSKPASTTRGNRRPAPALHMSAVRGPTQRLLCARIYIFASNT